jgi:hypothetical protein
MKIGKPVFRAMAKDAPDWLSSDCQLAGHHIAQGIAELDTGAPPPGGTAPRVAHPISLIRIAYGL